MEVDGAENEDTRNATSQLNDEIARRGLKSLHFRKDQLGKAGKKRARTGDGAGGEGGARALAMR